MILLDTNISSQEDMTAWLSQVNHPQFSLTQKGIPKLLAPQFVSCNYEEKSLVLAFDTFSWQLNPEGSLHGGMIATKFDASFGTLCRYYAKQNIVYTVNLNTSYLKAVLPHYKLYCHVKVVSLGKTLVSMTGEARLGENGPVAAIASTTFMISNKSYKEKI